ncbi:MAG: hypothetical protein J7K21_01410 [Desulfurococcales archaeon]|nr:hypothetical protein [Desulfurococcales archaeon]
MVTARARFIQKKISKKYGIVGKVAGRYIGAGYSVSFNKKVGDLTFDFIASKNRQILAIKIVSNTTLVKPGLVDQVAEAAKKISAKPVIILYGSGPSISEDALKKANEAGISIKRLRVR